MFVVALLNALGREGRGNRPTEVVLPVHPVHSLIGAKILRDGPGPSHSVDFLSAAPPLKRVRMNEIEIQTSETIETLEKKEKDQNELCAKLQEYRAIARERDEWKRSSNICKWPSRKRRLNT